MVDMSLYDAVHPLPNEVFSHVSVGAQILDLKLVGQYSSDFSILFMFINEFKFTC